MLAAFDRLMAVIPIGSLKIALLFFITGLVLDGVAVACSYWTQFSLLNEGFGRAKNGSHRWFLITATTSCIIGLGAFCAGAATAVLHAHLPIHSPFTS